MSLIPALSERYGFVLFVSSFFFFFKSLDRFIAVDPMTDASPFAPKGSQPDDLKLPVAKEGCG